MIGREGEQWFGYDRVARVVLAALAFSCSFGSEVLAQEPAVSERSRRMEYIEVRGLIGVVRAHPMLERATNAGGSRWPSKAWSDLDASLESLDEELGNALDGLFRRQRGYEALADEPIAARVRYEQYVLELLLLVRDRLLSREGGLKKLDTWVGESVADRVAAARRDGESPETFDGENAEKKLHPEAWERFELSDWNAWQVSLRVSITDERKRRDRVDRRLKALDDLMGSIEVDVKQAFNLARLEDLQQRIRSLRSEPEQLGARTGDRLARRQELEARCDKATEFVGLAKGWIVYVGKALDGSSSAAEASLSSGLAPELEAWQQRYLEQHWMVDSLSRLTLRAGIAREDRDIVAKTPANRRYGEEVDTAKDSHEEFVKVAKDVRGQLARIRERFEGFKHETLESLLNRKLRAVPETTYPETWPERMHASWIEAWAASHGSAEQMKLASRHADGSWRLDGRATAMILVDAGDHAFLIDRHEVTVGEFRDRLDWLESKESSLPRALYRWWTANKTVLNAMPRDRLLSSVPYEVASEFARYAYRRGERADYELALPSCRQFEAAMKAVQEVDVALPVATEAGSALSRVFDLPRVRPESRTIWGLESGLAELCGPEVGHVFVMGMSDYRPWTELPGGADEFARPGADHSGFFNSVRQRDAHLGAPAIGFRLVYNLERIN